MKNSIKFLIILSLLIFLFIFGNKNKTYESFVEDSDVNSNNVSDIIDQSADKIISDVSDPSSSSSEDILINFSIHDEAMYRIFPASLFNDGAGFTSHPVEVSDYHGDYNYIFGSFPFVRNGDERDDIIDGWTPRGMRGLVVGVSADLFNLKELEEANDPSVFKQHSYSVVSNYLFYTDKYKGKFVIPLCISVAVVGSESEGKLTFNLSLPRIEFDSSTKKVSCICKMPEFIINAREAEMERNAGTAQGRELEQIKLNPIYQFSSESASYDTFGIKDGINQISYTSDDIGNLKVYINGVLFGTFEVKADMMPGADEFGVVLTPVMLFSDIYPLVSDSSGGMFAPFFKNKDLEGIPEFWLDKIRNNEIAEMYLRKVRVYYKKVLSNSEIRNLYENREILMVGPRPYRSALFSQTKDFGEFELDRDYSQNVVLFDDDGLHIEQKIKLNVFIDTVTPPIAPVTSASVSEDSVDSESSDDGLISTALSSIGMSAGNTSKSLLESIGSGFSREYRFKFSPNNIEALRDSVKDSDSESFMIKRWGIYGFEYVQLNSPPGAPSEKKEISLRFVIDGSTKFRRIEPGVVYHICEVVSGNKASIYVNGEFLDSVNISGTSPNIDFMNRKVITLCGSTISDFIKIHWLAVKYFEKPLSPTEVNLLVYERMSGIEDLDEYDSRGMKGVFRNLLGDFSKFKKKSKEEIMKLVDLEVSKMRTAHRQEMNDRENNLSEMRNELFGYKKLSKLDKDKRVKMFLRENRNIDADEVNIKQRIKLKEKSVKKQKKRNQILKILLIISIISLVLISIYKWKGKEIIEYINDALGIKQGPDYLYSNAAKGRMTSYPGIRRLFPSF